MDGVGQGCMANKWNSLKTGEIPASASAPGSLPFYWMDGSRSRRSKGAWLQVGQSCNGWNSCPALAACI